MSDRSLILQIGNHHTASCGPPPRIEEREGQYLGYFENKHGEQMIFAFDRRGGTGWLYAGDAGWETPYEVVGGVVADLTLGPGKSCGYEPVGERLWERQTMRDHPCLRHLTPHEREVLAEFLSRLRERCGDRIAHVWLFGSKVRGDFDEESDVDLLIVAATGMMRWGRRSRDRLHAESGARRSALRAHGQHLALRPDGRAPRAHLQKYNA